MQNLTESHDPSEIILICWFVTLNMFLIIDVKNSCVLNFFVCGNNDKFFDEKIIQF